MLGVERAHLVDDRWVVLLGVGGDVLYLLWRHLRCLRRRDCRDAARRRRRRAGRSQNAAEHAAGGAERGRADRLQDLVQQAGLLNQILQTIGPAALGAAGGVLGSILGTTSTAAAAAGSVPTITPAQASQAVSYTHL